MRVPRTNTNNSRPIRRLANKVNVDNVKNVTWVTLEYRPLIRHAWHRPLRRTPGHRRPRSIPSPCVRAVSPQCTISVTTGRVTKCGRGGQRAGKNGMGVRVSPTFTRSFQWQVLGDNRVQVGNGSQIVGRRRAGAWPFSLIGP